MKHATLCEGLNNNKVEAAPLLCAPAIQCCFTLLMFFN